MDFMIRIQLCSTSHFVVFILYHLVHDGEKPKTYTLSLSAVVIRLQCWHCCSLKLHSSTRCRDKCSLSIRTLQLGCMHWTFAYEHFASWAWNEEVKCLALGHAGAFSAAFLASLKRRFDRCIMFRVNKVIYGGIISLKFIQTLKTQEGESMHPLPLPICLWILLEIVIISCRCQAWHRRHTPKIACREWN